ncbi:AbrB/MazE/SpoVT family DNA-binding domain-containing protein [Allomesorhizobium alhagi]|jgi:AbrB family looped-hinge helix DNA binding protein|uniref:Transcription regulator SpoVT/AbrB family protein n=1 Tax=Mesorhizobium alhagi CCNWXJ12-2 TaxID=1107882 RepID=H0HTA9_9HYPH|nr:AbrB/MazE/SpoVT family DNA-binding domain-containing protein [Mesorhizobium alhagi]EHK56050.1 transcription regulator SpoVT/AbrB family protein [Mesorhizobium alhagi CCNWXJ12-2]
MNARVRISSKGQLVLPKAVRDQFGLVAGSEVNIESTGSSIVLTPLRRKVRRKYTVDEVAGMLKYDGPPVSVRDMDRAVEEEFRRQWHAKGA